MTEWGLSGALEREEKEVGAVKEKMEAVGERRRRRAWKDRLLRKIAFMAVSCSKAVPPTLPIHAKSTTTFIVNSTKSKKVSSKINKI